MFRAKNISLKLQSCFLAVVVLLSGCFFIQAALGQEEITATLIEGAKKEGKLLWYTLLATTLAGNFVKKFQEKYPYIKLEFYRSGDEKLSTRIMAEARAKRNVFDVVVTTGIWAELLKKKGLLAKYLSPHRKFYPEGCKDSEGYWTDIFINLNTIGYNTRLVSRPEAPKTWNDLLDPKWKGKLGMDTKAYYWFANMLKMMGEEKGLEYMKKLSEQDIQFRTGRTLNTQMLVVGEVTIGITLYNAKVEEMKRKGAPIEWVAIEPVVPEIHPLAISAHAPHPNAAKIFVEFMLSKEGQEIMASALKIPSRTDVEAIVPKLKKGIKILPFDFSIADNYGKYIKLYREILMSKTN
ncbi:ABC transporter substrate-binding protein [Thermodesulfobacteriota bacterium]